MLPLNKLFTDLYIHYFDTLIPMYVSSRVNLFARRAMFDVDRNVVKYRSTYEHSMYRLYSTYLSLSNDWSVIHSAR